MNDPFSLRTKGKEVSLDVIGDALSPTQWLRLKTNLLYLATHDLGSDAPGFEELKAKVKRMNVELNSSVPSPKTT